MKTLFKLPMAALACAFLVSNLTSCTKDASQTPSLKDPSLGSANSLAAAQLCKWGHKPPPPPKCDCKIDSSSFGLTSLLAGSGGQGYTNGTGTGARFYYPYNIATDPAGNVYVTESGDGSIRQITPTGVVTTYAGSQAVYGSADGYRTSATFFGPGAMGFGSDGSLYVADPNNHLIRKISPSGTVSTIAGNGNPGTADGSALGATILIPELLAVDSHNNIYLVDGYNQNIVRKITPSGTISTLVGNPDATAAADGTGASAAFNFIMGITVDAAGNIYVTDGSIRKITPAGVVTTFAGEPGAKVTGPTVTGNFRSAGALAFDSAGNLFSGWGDNIVEVTSSLKVLNVVGVAGTPGSANGSRSVARFDAIDGITIDKNGNLYVADQYNNQIRKVIVGIPPCKMTPPPAKPIVSK